MGIDDIIEHERIVNLLVDRLKASKRYTSIQKHVNYSNRRVHGEADVVAMTGENIHYYEVKIHFNESSEYKAHRQFKRFGMCADVVTPKYIYVTPVKVKRAYL